MNLKKKKYLIYKPIKKNSLSTWMKVPAVYLIVTDGDCFAMMVYFSILVIPKSVHVGVNQNHDKWVK